MVLDLIADNRVIEAVFLVRVRQLDSPERAEAVFAQFREIIIHPGMADNGFPIQRAGLTVAELHAGGIVAVGLQVDQSGGGGDIFARPEIEARLAGTVIETDPVAVERPALIR